MSAKRVREASFPLRVERFNEDGWFFVACDGIPGLTAFGPDLEDVFRNLEIAGTELLRRRGREVLSMKVEAVSKDVPERERSWSRMDLFALRPMEAAM